LHIHNSSKWIAKKTGRRFQRTKKSAGDEKSKNFFRVITK
jgi:hypothetical protein